MLSTEIPSYLNDQLHFNIASSGSYSALPYIARYLCSIGFGMLFEYLEIYQILSTRTIRQTAQAISFIGCGVCLIACVFVPSPFLSFAFLILSLGCFGAIESGLSCSYSDISIRHSSLLNTMGTCFGVMVGSIAPLAVSFYTTHWDGIWGWRYLFLTTNLFLLLSILLWIRFQTSMIIPELN